MRGKGANPLLLEISGILGMSATSREILYLLMKTKKKLSVVEITTRLRRSERAVRGHLKSLHEIGLVRREWVTTRKRRHHYRYSALRVKGLVKSVQMEMRRRIKRIRDLYCG